MFVAHREEILKQARHTYRQVLHDPNFGELLTGHHDPEQHNHLFAMIHTLQNRSLLAQLGADYWQVVVIDECDDEEDYHKISWGQPQLEQQQLSNLLTGNQMRARTIINNWRNRVHCNRLNAHTRASQKVHHKAPLAGKGGSLSKSGNAGVGLLGSSLRASRQAAI